MSWVIVYVLLQATLLELGIPANKAPAALRRGVVATGQMLLMFLVAVTNESADAKVAVKRNFVLNWKK